MFDSPTQQPDPSSTIDFLHNEESTVTKSSHSKASAPVELAHVEQEGNKDKKSPSPGGRSFFSRFFSRVAQAFQRHPAVPNADGVTKTSSPIPAQKNSLPTLVHQDPVLESTDFGKGDYSAGVRATPPHTHESVSLPTGTRGRSIEKIPLDKFRDPKFSVKRTSDSEVGEQKHPNSILFHRDRDPNEDEVDVNLLPTERHAISPRAKHSIVILLLSLEFLGLLIGFLIIQAKADGRLLGLRELESQQTLLDIQVKRYREVVKEATNLQQQAVVLRGVVKRRADVLGMLAWFESHTIDSVHYEGLTVSESGEVLVHVVAPSALDASYQMNILYTTKLWNKVALSGITLGEEKDGLFRVEFDVALTGFTNNEK